MNLRILLLLGLSLTGCGSYQLGGPTPTFREIELRPTRSTVARPGVLPALDQALRASFGAEARLRLRPGGAPLELTVISYERTAATRAANDAFVATYYRVTLRATASLRSADGRRTAFINRPFEAHAVLEASNDFAGEENRILPRLSAELAAQVREASVGAW